MTVTSTPYRSALPAGRGGFAQLLRAEWTKLRTVRGWLVGLAAAAVLPVLLGFLTAVGNHTSCDSARNADPAACTRPLGPGGEAVSDRFSFVHQALEGDGSITVRVTSLTGLLPTGDDDLGMRSGVHEWAKAGLIVKESSVQGSSYAAVMITGGHGVRMQYDYIHDTAGRTGTVAPASPRWLRLTRTGDTLTGYESADGTRWTEVGTAQLGGLATTVQAGLFVASPDHDVTDKNIGFTVTRGGPSQATATFDRLTSSGPGSSEGWSGTTIGDDGGPQGAPRVASGFEESGGTFTVSGSGDIAPVVGRASGETVGDSTATAFAGLLVVIVLATMFVTTEYRRGLIRTTLAATPRRGRVLAAKAVVLAGVTFVAGLVGTAVAYWVVARSLRDSGHLLPASSLTEWRVVAGTAALFAVAAVLALAVGTILRRSAGAITAIVVLIVLPYILAVSPVVPAEPGRWLLRVTPAAAFAIQQNAQRYAHVSADYTPSGGYYPLAPWAGFAVLCVWTLAALGLAQFVLRRRDA